MTLDQQQSINKYLTELPVEQGGFGECWHSPETKASIPYRSYYDVCPKCKKTAMSSEWGRNPDYFSDSGFVKLLRRVKESEKCKLFIATHSRSWGIDINPNIIDPAIFAAEWAYFCGFPKHGPRDRLVK